MRRAWCIKVYPQIKKSIRWFRELFSHAVAKYFYLQLIRAIEFAWIVFTFFLGYKVFLAGAIRIQPNPDNGDIPVVITVGLATQLVNAFWVLLALGVAFSILRTIQFSRDWIRGKRPTTLTALSQKLESIETRLDTELTSVDDRLKAIETTTNDRLKNIEITLKSLVEDKKKKEKD